MEYEEFKKLLKDNGLTIKFFSKISNTNYQTCMSWSLTNRGVPTWVKPFILLYAKDVECMKYKESVETILRGLQK